MGARNFEDLKRHVGHKIVCVAYGEKDNPENIAIECEDCGEVLFDYDKITIVRDLAEQHTEMYRYDYKWEDAECPELKRTLTEVLKRYGYGLIDLSIDGEYNDLKAYLNCEIRKIRL